MKCMFLAPVRYPFIRSIESGIKANGIEVKTVDYQDFFTGRTNRFVKKLTNLPNRLKPWERSYEKKINREYQRIFDNYRPDFVFVYNNQLAHPEFFEYIRGKAKVVFMLGDNPLYTRTSRTNLHILFYADYIISPDSLWREQLMKIGVKHIVFDCFGFSDEIYYPMEVSEENRGKYQSDFIYVGSAQKINWGYKRALFLNIFQDFDLKAYISGEGMEIWLEYFPELRGKVLPHDRFDPEFNNLVYNCSKIAPVELVPSLFNGVHVRVFDALGAGILPLCEYSTDLLRVFDQIDIPAIYDYQEGKALAEYWLRENEKRLACIQKMRERVIENYSPRLVIKRMLEKVFQ